MALMSSAEVDKEIIRRAKLTDRTHAVRKVEYMRYYQGFILTRKFMIKTATLLYFFIHFIYIVLTLHTTKVVGFLLPAIIYS